MADSSPLPPLGFLAVEVDIFRPPGDPYNECTWNFPLIRELVSGTSESQLVTNKAYDDAFIDRFVTAGLKLAERGAVGIITSCGFLAIAQKRLAACLPIPVATSALIQIPSIQAIIPADKKVGIMTYDSDRLSDAHLIELGINLTTVYIRGAPADGHLRGICSRGAKYDAQKLEVDLVEQASALLSDHGDIGAVVLECTNMPPCAEAIQRALELPVYDVYTMGMWFYSSLTRCTPKRWQVQPGGQ